MPDTAVVIVQESLQRHEIKDGDEVPLPFVQRTDLIRKSGEQLSLKLALRLIGGHLRT